MNHTTRESRIRRVAARHGLQLHKQRCRNPAAVEHGTYYLSDPSTNGAVYGGDFSCGGFPDLDQIERYLRELTA